ncbi:hypothetical protein SESBI_38405 [Sesbania bispinosa]|nr:hypothetical protein SESBI_38405 [Sesbania bispinosa]
MANANIEVNCPQLNNDGFLSLTAPVLKEEVKQALMSMDHRLWHPVSWTKFITPKKEGGLGVRESRCTNTSLLGKLVWDFIHKEDKFWVRVLKAKYLPSGSILSASRTVNASPVWNGIIKAKDAIKDGFRFRLGPGDSSLWFTDWTGFGLLGDMVPFVHTQDLNLGVRDVISANRWNFNPLDTFLAQEVLDKITPFVPRLNESATDCWAWQAANHGIYSAAVGYKWLLHKDFLHQTTPMDLGWV